MISLTSSNARTEPSGRSVTPTGMMRMPRPRHQLNEIFGQLGPFHVGPFLPQVQKCPGSVRPQDGGIVKLDDIPAHAVFGRVGSIGREHQPLDEQRLDHVRDVVLVPAQLFGQFRHAARPWPAEVLASASSAIILNNCGIRSDCPRPIRAASSWYCDSMQTPPNYFGWG